MLPTLAHPVRQDLGSLHSLPLLSVLQPLLMALELQASPQPSAGHPFLRRVETNITTEPSAQLSSPSGTA